jgi:hypothetical protein
VTAHRGSVKGWKERRRDTKSSSTTFGIVDACDTGDMLPSNLDSNRLSCSSRRTGERRTRFSARTNPRLAALFDTYHTAKAQPTTSEPSSISDTTRRGATSLNPTSRLHAQPCHESVRLRHSPPLVSPRFSARARGTDTRCKGKQSVGAALRRHPLYRLFSRPTDHEV